MDTTIKITSLHLVVGIITGIISTGFTLSWFGIKNDVFATALAFIILYSAYFVKPKRKEIFSVRIQRLEKLYGMCYNRTKLPETLAKLGKSEPERNQCL